MIGIIMGSLLVMFSLYRLYFLLKPLFQVSHALIKQGAITDVKAYTDEIEQLRIEILELNDAFYNQLNMYEKRIEFLENHLEVKKKNQKKENVYKDFEMTLSESSKDKSKTLSIKDENSPQKVIHPLFDRVRGLHKLGYKDQDIAKELGIGVSEVQLLIKRIEES
jgi:ribosomal protein S15P/S13E